MASTTLGSATDRVSSWRASFWAGIIAGAVFLVGEMALAPAVGASPWAPARMIAAIVAGRGVLPPPATFHLGIVLLALVIHFILSVVYALLLSPLVAGVGRRAAAVVGTLYGLVLYLVNFYGFTALFPWFAMARNWVSVVMHLVFGAAAAYSYKVLARQVHDPVITSTVGRTA